MSFTMHDYVLSSAQYYQSWFLFQSNAETEKLVHTYVTSRLDHGKFLLSGYLKILPENPLVDPKRYSESTDRESKRQSIFPLYSTLFIGSLLNLEFIKKYAPHIQRVE